jgi:hypothetical protein
LIRSTKANRPKPSWGTGKSSVLLILVSTVLVVACGESDSSPGASGGASGSTGGRPGNPSVPERDATGDFIQHTYEPTYAAVYNEIFLPTCAAAFCHMDDELGFNALTPDRGYETTVSVVSTTEVCGSTRLQRIAPGHPEQSLLYLKLTVPPCGRKMPQTFSQQLDPREIEQIRQWIEKGALRDEASDAGADGG